MIKVYPRKPDWSSQMEGTAAQLLEIVKRQDEESVGYYFKHDAWKLRNILRSAIHLMPLETGSMEISDIGVFTFSTELADYIRKAGGIEASSSNYPYLEWTETTEDEKKLLETYVYACFINGWDLSIYWETHQFLFHHSHDEWVGFAYAKSDQSAETMKALDQLITMTLGPKNKKKWYEFWVKL